MKKNIGIIGILIGIFAFMYTFSNLPFQVEFIGNIDISIMILVEIIGIVVSVFALIKYKTKIISFIGILLNTICIVYVVLTFLLLG